MIFNAGSRSRIEEDHWAAKFTLRLITLIAVIISMGTAGYSWPFSWWLFIPLGISFIWTIANIAVRLSRPRPMVPGANVGMDLVLWLMFLITVAITYLEAVIGMAFHATINTDDNGNSFYNVRGYVYYCSNSDLCGDVNLLNTYINRWGTVALVAAIFGTIAFINHFILFVFACVDTHHRRAARYYGGKGYRTDAELANRNHGQMPQQQYQPQYQQ